MYIFGTVLLSLLTERKIKIMAEKTKKTSDFEYKTFKINHGSTLKKIAINQLWICQVMSGKVRILFNLVESELVAGDCFAVLEGVFFKILSTDENFEMDIVAFDTKFLNVVYPLIGSEADWSKIDDKLHIFNHLPQPYCQLLINDFESLKLMTGLKTDTLTRKMMFSLTAHFLISYYKAVYNLPSDQENASGGRSYQILSRFYSLISEQSPLTERGSQYYADRLNISVRHLFKICKNEANQTPKDIINEFLTGEIQNTLLTTDLSIQEITDRFSFPAPTAFGQFFKRQTGMSPGGFRKKFA